MDLQAIQELCKDIRKKNGEGSIFTIGSSKSALKIPRWSTSIEAFDEILGGGMPKGRVIEIFGPSSSGKTSLAYWLMSLHELGLYIPIEGCVDCDTEYFNGYEWKKISEYKEGEKVLQYNADGTATLEYPEKYVVYDSDILWHVYTKNRMDSVISEYHNVVYKNPKSDEVKIKPFHELRERIEKGTCNIDIPKAFSYSGEGISLSDEDIRVMVAVFADGTLYNYNTNYCTVILKKERKINRLRELLNKADIEFKEKKKENYTHFVFYCPIASKHYPDEWYNMNKHQFEVVIDEMQWWDGSHSDNRPASFGTVHKKDADFMQFAYTALGYASYICTRNRIGRDCRIQGRKIKCDKVSYDVCASEKSNKVNLKHAKIEPYITKDKKMYCFTMKSRMWVMRRNNKIIVTGNTYDEQRALAIGVKPKQMIVHRAQYGEEAINDIIKFAKAGIPIICLDSVPACQPKDDIEKIEKNAENEMKIGGVARLFSKSLPSIVHICEETGTTLILINQVRAKMDAMLFGEKEDTPGGNAIKFYTSVRVKVARRAWIEIPNKNPAVSSENEKVGLIMKAKIQKSKVGNPYGEAELPFFFDRGFCSFDDIKPIRAELMKQRKEEFR